MQGEAKVCTPITVDGNSSQIRHKSTGGSWTLKNWGALKPIK